MYRKRIALILIAVMLAAVFIGCKKAPGGPASSAEPAEGTAAGGKAISNANAKSLTIEHKGNDTVVTISFVLGSKIAGVDEAIADGVPAYKAYTTQSPVRFVLEFEALEFWDYDRAVDVKDDSLLYSVFKQLRSGDDRFQMFFQLKQDATFKIKESKDQLVVTFTPQKSEDTEQYYVTADALSLFSEGALSDGIGLMPALCSDLENTTLISQPFATQAEAESFRNQLLQDHAELFTAGQLTVIALQGNGLPEYSAGADFEQAENKSIIRRNGEQITLPAVMPNGIYLCSTPDGTRALFSKQLGDGTQPAPAASSAPTSSAAPEAASDSTIDVEELWLMDANGKFKRLSEIEFATLEQAQFSPDGKKLAILERTTDSSYLYIFDMETNALVNLGDEGFGTNTGTFVWDALGTAIYAITGNDSQRLLKYDFTIPDETARITSVEERDIEDGDLGFFNGELYFANVDDQGNEQIFKIKPEGGLRNQFASGNSFSISPDGKSMAILESRSTVEEETNANTSLKIKDMATGKETYVLKDAYIISFDWDPSGTLYYITGSDLSSDDPYPYRFNAYAMDTGKSQELCDLAGAEFFTTQLPGQLYLPYISLDESESIRATYLLDLAKFQ